MLKYRIVFYLICLIIMLSILFVHNAHSLFSFLLFVLKHAA